MSEPYFDVRFGELLLDEETVSIRLEQSGIGDVMPLAKLLVAKEFSFAGDEFEKLDVEDWERDDYVAYGKWVLNVLRQSEDEKPKITRTIIKRMHLLGLGPSEERISAVRRFGNLTNFKRAAGSAISHVQHGYDDWTLQDFIDHARRVERAVGGKPTKEDYINFFRENGGPSYDTICSKEGGIVPIHEHLGYPDIKRMKEKDHIFLGTRIMEANDNQLHWAMIYVLSVAGRAPSLKAISDNFGSWGRYQLLVEREYKILQSYRETLRASRLQKYRDRIDSGSWPESMGVLDAAAQLRQGAILTVAETLFPGKLDGRAVSHISHVTPEATIRHLHRFKRQLTTDEFERKAMELALFEDIWPDDEHLNYLHVTEEQLKTARDMAARRQQRKRMREAQKEAA